MLEINDIILESVTRLMNNMVPAKESTNKSYLQPLEAYRGKQCQAKHDVSNYGLQGVCIKQNVVKPTFLKGFFKGDLEEHVTVTNLTIAPTALHWDFNMNTGLNTRISQEIKDRPLIDSLIRTCMQEKKTNNLYRIMMFSVPALIEQKGEPIQGYQKFFVDPDFGLPREEWGTHFIDSSTIVFNYA